MNKLSLNKKITLFVFSFLGLLVVNPMYLYWQFFQFEFTTFFNNTIAIALFIEVLLYPKIIGPIPMIVSMKLLFS